MTPDIADVRVVQSMVDTMVGIERFSYPARQKDAPKPSGEFAHIRVLEEYQVGIPARRVTAQDDNTTTFTTYSLVSIRVRVGVVDTTGIPSMKVMQGWTSEKMKALMISTGYGFVKCNPLSNEDSKLEKDWEYRKGFSVEFYVTRVYEEVVDNITSVNISGRYMLANVEDTLLNYEINNE